MYQQQLEAEADGKFKFFGCSVNETIRICIMNGLSKKADKIKSDFKVPDKRYVRYSFLNSQLFSQKVHHSNTSMVSIRFWYTKLYALTESRDFEALEAFSRSKRSPIGYEAFVRHLVEKGHANEAVNYVAKCDPPRRADLYVDCGEWRMAGRECKERNDKAKLEYATIVFIHIKFANLMVYHFLGSCGRRHLIQ